ncbi:MAG: PIG-L family deacetylase [Chloroflexi bacterium]|nr:PIG-L family deacetylase [Chloroflexota bacterium]
MTTDISASWPEKQRILVILAHPDDPEFFCGASLARWALAGHEISYSLLTCGDKGRNDFNRDIPGSELCALRHKEERAAADVLGVGHIQFLDKDDGYLVPDLILRKEVVRIIRQLKPDILVTCDPQNLFATYGLNHPDHRAAGQVVLDAVFPASGNELFFPDLLDEGWLPHSPKEVWASLTNQPNAVLDVTDTWDIKIRALKEHKSQIGDPEKLEERMRSRRTEDSTDENPRYEEKFRVISWR